MLKVNIIVSEESTFSGALTVYFNCGGVTGIKKIENSSLKFTKADTVNTQSYISSPPKST